MSTNNMIHTSFGIREEFDVALVKCDSEGNPIEEPRVVLKNCPNLITDTGMNLIGSTGFDSFRAFVQVGTGNTAPSNSNTSLVNRIAGVAGVFQGVTWDATNPKTAVFTIIYTFAAGAATGNLAELGLSVTTSGTLNTRALFVDGGGSPITVTVLSDEQLVLTYRIFVVPNETDSVLNTTQKGTPYTLTLRPSDLSVAFADSNNFTGQRLGAIITTGSGAGDLVVYSGASSDIGTTIQSPTGTATSIVSGTTPAYGTYTSGDFYRDDTLHLPLSVGNISTVGAYRFEGYPFRTQLSVSPRVTKTSLDTMTFTIRTAWARI